MAHVDFQHSGDEGTAMGVDALVIALAVVSVALRFYTRIFTRAGLNADDWLIMLAVLTTLLTAVMLLWVNAVCPPGLWDSESTDPSYIYTREDRLHLKFAFATSVLYFTISGATKLGILFMYHRIFATNRTFRYLTFTASALVVGWWIGCTVASLTGCIPLDWNWINNLADPRYCFNYNIFWMASGACEIFLDILILLLPITAVIRVRLSLKQKLTVSGIFLLGGIVIITGLVKVILGYPPGKRVPSYFDSEMWATVHTGMAIVCSCLPIFKPLVNRISESRLIVMVSSILSVRRSGESLRSIPTIISDPERGERSGKGNNNGQADTSPLVTIREASIYDSYFSQPGVAYSGDGATCSTEQQEPTAKAREM